MQYSLLNATHTLTHLNIKLDSSFVVNWKTFGCHWEKLVLSIVQMCWIEQSNETNRRGKNKTFPILSFIDCEIRWNRIKVQVFIGCLWSTRKFNKLNFVFDTYTRITNTFTAKQSQVNRFFSNSSYRFSFTPLVIMLSCGLFAKNPLCFTRKIREVCRQFFGISKFTLNWICFMGLSIESFFNRNSA